MRFSFGFGFWVLLKVVALGRFDMVLATWSPVAPFSVLCTIAIRRHYLTHAAYSSRTPHNCLSTEVPCRTSPNFLPLLSHSDLDKKLALLPTPVLRHLYVQPAKASTASTHSAASRWRAGSNVVASHTSRFQHTHVLQLINARSPPFRFFLSPRVQRPPGSTRTAAAPPKECARSYRHSPTHHYALAAWQPRPSLSPRLQQASLPSACQRRRYCRVQPTSAHKVAR